MDELERDAARLLGALRDFEAPGSGAAGLERAVRSGRRRARARRVAATASTAVAVVLIVVAAVLAGRPGRAPEPRPAAPAGHFDTRRHAFTVGSAGGFAPESYRPGRDVQRITLRVEHPGGTLRADGVVEMYPAGGLPPGSGGRSPAGRPAPDVHGHRAYVLATPVLRPGAVELAWEWSPGAWGFVSLRGAGADETRAQRVAQSVLPVDAQAGP
ncbi:hypothetical protein AGRA3207_007819 [Actinomadura graeca]|uniref:Uncharacterized protein n=1 Tax=Actinomadura graeca TaxID=2750812 RepID=A0ABX8R893_9ACTN|nr:hypothetical protein [Actinomadura graeca]QXJ26197.1 hypothetical protein AGRA3207_007819 [Actinomadura graeca]